MSRDRRIVIGFAVLALTMSTGVAVHVKDVQVPEVQVVQRDVDAGPDAVTTVQFAGDTMLGDGSQPLIDAKGFDAPFLGVRPLLTGDFVIANAEAPLTKSTIAAAPGKSFIYHTDPAAAQAMRRAGIHALGLGNNHAMDMGAPGLTDTLASADAAGLATFGAGANLQQAERPLLLDSPAGKVAIVALGENFGAISTAKADHGGTVILEPATVQRGLDLARAAGAKMVIAYVHWGDNYSDIVPEQRYWAQQLAAAGYDMVIGTGPHVVQPVEVIDSVPVFYSIGNFVFGAPGRFAMFGKPGSGLLLNLNLSATAPARIEAQCIGTDNTQAMYVPRPCDAPLTALTRNVLGSRMVLDPSGTKFVCTCSVRQN